VQIPWLNKEVSRWRNFSKDKIRDKMAKIKVTKVKSAINRTQNQKRVLEALGLRKIGHTVEHQDTPNILGMINKVKHLVSVEETK
tara:strand:- start:484 stop:738 length:255 start_codon:yes stop_codon:yes gene_type:complete